MTTYVPFANYPFKYVNDFLLSNNITTPNSIVDLTAGNCRDSTNTFQIVSNDVININITNLGINGLDFGTVTTNALYCVYVIADAFNGLPPAGLISSSATSPVMPDGYNIFKLIGYVRTDGSSNIMKGYWSGNGTNRSFVYDLEIIALSGGAATSYTAVSLSNKIPAIQNTMAYINIVGTPSAASRVLALQPYGATGDFWSIGSQVATVLIFGGTQMPTRLNSGAPSISYKWTAGGGDAVDIYVAGYEYSV